MIASALPLHPGSTSVDFLTWTSTAPTGGNVYDDRLTAALLEAGIDLRRHHVRGTWPAECEQHRDEVAALLRTRPVWLVDSIIACAVPDLVTEAADRGRPMTVLLHSLLSTELGLPEADRRRYEDLEGAALRAAGLVVTTSQWAADDLSRRYGVTHTVVAHPGVDVVPVVPGSPGGTHLLSLGSLTPTKNQLGFVAALSRTEHLPWSARVVGGDLVQPDYSAALRRVIDREGLSDRIAVTGPLSGSALDEVWRDTDLLVVTSRSETYGMVVVEALAHGIPAVVSAGTGAVEALGAIDDVVPGTSVMPDDADALADVLRLWLTDRALRQRWRDAARRRREGLTSWHDCAAVVRAALLDLHR
ncbi:MAG TPA: glycosyltransferase family 4 protein [Microlunatus sp.]|nr:glycosyltransferase family 4 protein [Microlunatus sp.]